MSKWKVIGLAMGLLLGVFIFLWIITGRWLAEGLKPVAHGENSYAIVLGAKVNGTAPSLSLRYRLEAALDYARKYENVKLILSGGQGPDEDISEAEAMKTFLVNHGIDKERLILEADSTSTYENFKFSKALLPEDITAITIISSDYHLSRAKKIAQKFELKPDVVAAKTPKIVNFKVRTRERVALLKTYIVGQ